MEFSVPAVIPVFIGARVIKKAGRSAIQQPEVTEVMIINNGSTDTTQSYIGATGTRRRTTGLFEARFVYAGTDRYC